EDRRPKTEDRRPKTEDRRPKTEDRRPKTEDRRPKTEDRRPKTEDPDMWKNYTLIAWRNLKKHRAYAFINVVGLTLGIAACLMIGLYVQDELSYDRHVPDGEQVYRVNQYVTDNGAAETWAWTGGGLGPAMQRDLPQVEAVARLAGASGSMRRLAEDGTLRVFRETDFYYTDSAINDVLKPAFILGDPAAAFDKLNAVVLSASAAERYFGDENPLGKTLEFVQQGTITLEVTGVVADVPENSHLTYDFLASFGAHKQMYGVPTESEYASYWWPVSYTYVRLPDAQAAATLEAALPEFSARNREDGERYVPTLEALHDIYLYSEATSGPSATGNAATVRIFGFIALAILVLACINFMNLSTARSAQRAREVGVRKSLGAERTQVAMQFLGESIFMSVVALVLAVAVVEMLLPAFNDLAGRAIDIDYGANVTYWMGIVALVLFTGVLAGAYPAFYLASFRPTEVLKGLMTRTGGHAGVRKGLVVFQFAVSVVLIVGTTVVLRQLDYLRDADLGFDQEQTVVLRLGSGLEWEELEDQLEQQAQVVSVSSSTLAPGYGGTSSLPYRTGAAWNDENATGDTGHQHVDVGYFEMLGIPVLAGRTFSEDRPADGGVRPDNGSPYFHIFEQGHVVNEAFARANGWTPETALGERVRMTTYENGVYYTDLRGTIVGVVGDYHQRSLRSEILPMVFTPAQNAFGHMGGNGIVKLAPGNAADAMAMIRGVWQEVAPDQPFEASFLDQNVQNLYVREAQLGRVVTAFAFIGIVIACLGLFGLVSYAAERRTKEIGIRKVLGASVPGLTGLLMRDFLVLVGVATVIATPVAYVAMDRWLQTFAYQVDVGLGVFVLAGIVASVIAAATVSYQAIKTARRNPVTALRYE
ncbi:MAG: ABC transporter permease, partial [Bacteroidota bacterium]